MTPAPPSSGRGGSGATARPAGARALTCSAPVSPRRSAGASAGPDVTPGALVTADRRHRHSPPCSSSTRCTWTSRAPARTCCGFVTTCRPGACRAQGATPRWLRSCWKMAAPTHPGRLAFADVTIDPTTASVTLRAVFPNPRAAAAALYVRAMLAEGVRAEAILLPQQAPDPRCPGQCLRTGGGHQIISCFQT